MVELNTPSWKILTYLVLKRENLRLSKAMAFRELNDKRINQTLLRCDFTSLTTLLAMLPMAVWGGPAVESFAIPPVIGVMIATSSSTSTFIVAPVLLFHGEWQHRPGARLRVDPEVPACAVARPRDDAMPMMSRTDGA